MPFGKLGLFSPFTEKQFERRFSICTLVSSKIATTLWGSLLAGMGLVFPIGTTIWGTSSRLPPKSFAVKTQKTFLERIKLQGKKTIAKKLNKIPPKKVLPKANFLTGSLFGGKLFRDIGAATLSSQRYGKTKKREMLVFKCRDLVGKEKRGFRFVSSKNMALNLCPGILAKNRNQRFPGELASRLRGLVLENRTTLLGARGSQIFLKHFVQLKWSGKRVGIAVFAFLLDVAEKYQQIDY